MLNDVFIPTFYILILLLYHHHLSITLIFKHLQSPLQLFCLLLSGYL